MKRQTVVITLVVDEVAVASAMADADILVDLLDKIYHFHSAEVGHKGMSHEYSEGGAESE